jgi:hypothetical protein
MIQETGYPEDTLTYVYPGGVVSLATAGGRFLVRCGLDWMHCPQTGLVAELDRVSGLTLLPKRADFAAPFQLVGGAEPVPWRSRQLRDAAALDLAARVDLDESLRDELVLHVRLTPFYEGF